MTLTPAQLCRSAVLQLIGTLPGSTTPTLVPQTTLSTAANAGDTALTVASITNFLPVGTMRFLDGSADPAYAVGTTTATSIPLDPVRGPTALAGAHPSGTTVATNLVTTFPYGAQDMLDSGYPVIAVVLLDKQKTAPMTRGWMPQYLLSIGYILPVYRQDEMHPSLWGEHQTDRAESDMHTIVTAMQTNTRLPLNGAPTAMEITKFVQSFRGNTTDYGSTAVWEAWCDVTIIGNGPETLA